MNAHPLLLSLAAATMAIPSATTPVAAQTANRNVPVPSDISPDNIRRCLEGIVLSYTPGSHRAEGTNRHRDVQCRTVIRMTGDDNIRSVDQINNDTVRITQQYSTAAHYPSGIYRIAYRIDSDGPQPVASTILQDRADETTDDIRIVSSSTEGSNLIETYAEFSARYMQDPRKGPLILQDLDRVAAGPGITLNRTFNADGSLYATFNESMLALLHPSHQGQFEAVIRGHEGVLSRNLERGPGRR